MKNGLILTLLLVVIATVGCDSENQNKQSKNNTLDVIHARKSVRHYTPQAVEQEKIDIMLKAAMAAPSARDMRVWEFVVVTDKEKMAKLAEVLPYAKMLKNAPMAIVVCGNSDVENGGSAHWHIDGSAATQNILLAAESIGLGAVWTAAYPYPERMKPISESLELPANIKPLCLIPIGYPAGETKPKDKFDVKKVHYNKW